MRPEEAADRTVHLRTQSIVQSRGRAGISAAEGGQELAVVERRRRRNRDGWAEPGNEPQLGPDLGALGRHPREHSTARPAGAGTIRIGAENPLRRPLSAEAASPRARLAHTHRWGTTRLRPPRPPRWQSRDERSQPASTNVSTPESQRTRATRARIVRVEVRRRLAHEQIVDTKTQAERHRLGSSARDGGPLPRRGDHSGRVAGLRDVQRPRAHRGSQPEREPGMGEPLERSPSPFSTSSFRTRTTDPGRRLAEEIDAEPRWAVRIWCSATVPVVGRAGRCAGRGRAHGRGGGRRRRRRRCRCTRLCGRRWWRGRGCRCGPVARYGSSGRRPGSRCPARGGSRGRCRPGCRRRSGRVRRRCDLRQNGRHRESQRPAAFRRRVRRAERERALDHRPLRRR